MDNPKITKIASIVIGIFIAIVLILIGFRILQKAFTRAEDIAPKDVVVTSLTQNSAQITWATGQGAQSVVEYGTTPTALNFFAPETKIATSHSVDLTLLSPTTTYYFQIRVGDMKFDNGGVPWSFTTKGKDSVNTTTTNNNSQVTPTRVLTQPTATPLPGCSYSSSCIERDCQKIKDKIGQGCTARDYSCCITHLSPTPTLMVAPTITTAPTP